MKVINEFDLTGRFALQRGMSWSLKLRCLTHPGRRPVDLTGMTATLEIYDTQGETPPVEFAPAAPLGDEGTMEWALSPEQTAALTLTAARYRIVRAKGAQRSVYLRGRLAVLESDL